MMQTLLILTPAEIAALGQGGTFEDLARVIGPELISYLPHGAIRIIPRAERRFWELAQAPCGMPEKNSEPPHAFVPTLGRQTCAVCFRLRGASHHFRNTCGTPVRERMNIK